MSDLLEEYKSYYSVRAERYAGNPNYKNSYQAEKNLSDAMQSCAELGEFRHKIGNLNQLCAVALIKDKYLIEQAFYREMKEDVRVRVADRVLEKVDGIDEVFNLISMVNDVETKVMIEISMDEANRLFHYMWNFIDLSEVYAEADVPDEYKARMQKYAEEYRQILRDSLQSLIENNSHWQGDWKHEPDVVTEHRHRRLLPFSDEHIAEQLVKYKKILNL